VTPETAADVLRRCQMPPDEIRWVLTAEDLGIVHMILELHRERLDEELAERRKALAELEICLAERMEWRTQPSGVPPARGEGAARFGRDSERNKPLWSRHSST
jgi:hypothetical protein